MDPITAGSLATAELSDATDNIINTTIPQKASLFIISLLCSNKHAMFLS
jgi:hypothetical protein